MNISLHFPGKYKVCILVLSCVPARITKIILLGWFWLVPIVCSAQVTPLIHAHAHNDYMHNRPLFEALENGFTSIEIDVFLHNGELKVAHEPIDLDGKKTIEELYLDPIKKVIAQNGGRVYKGYNAAVIFMIDFKTSGAETYAQLKKVLKNYEDLITIYKNDSVIQQRAINILISGNSPAPQLLKEDSAFATLDAGMQSMENTSVSKVSTRFSSAWETYFMWRGKGNIPVKEKMKLDSLVAKAHQLKKEIRFYHIPDKPVVWQTLLAAGVDWINTDKLEEFRKFTEQKK